MTRSRLRQQLDLEPTRPELIGQTAICKRLGISDETWRKWRKRGIAPRPVVPGYQPRWNVADIDAFVAGSSAPGGSGRHYFASSRPRKLALVHAVQSEPESGR